MAEYFQSHYEVSLRSASGERGRNKKLTRWYDNEAFKKIPRAKAVVTADVELTENNALAFDVWYLMGGLIDWDALQFLLEYFQVEDTELLVESLFYIRSRAK